jgi:transposase-like protein
MCRMIRDLATLDQFLIALFSTPEIFRPNGCDSCGRSGLWFHGYYHRKNGRSLWAADERTPIPIPRFLCPHCGVTCSRLPEFLAPRRWYPWSRQALALLLSLLGVSDRQTAAWVDVSRQTVGRWRRWLQERELLFVFYLRGLFPALGRVGEGAPFWRQTMDSPGLAAAMGAICRQGEVVP